VRANLLYGYRPALIENELFTLGHVAEVMEITRLLERNVTTLSGGEQQRVAFPPRHSFGASSASFG
jgi:ABC-type molybdate transport system ATPase subunit